MFAAPAPYRRYSLCFINPYNEDLGTVIVYLYAVLQLVYVLASIRPIRQSALLIAILRLCNEKHCILSKYLLAFFFHLYTPLLGMKKKTETDAWYGVARARFTSMGKRIIQIVSSNRCEILRPITSHYYATTYSSFYSFIYTSTTSSKPLTNESIWQI